MYVFLDDVFISSFQTSTTFSCASTKTMTSTSSSNTKIDADATPREPPEWHAQEEQVLKRWSEVCSSYQYMHNRSYKMYTNMHMRYSLPVIVLSSIASTLSFATGSFRPEWREYVTLCTGGLNLVSGLIVTIAQFHKIPDLMEAHRSSQTDFGRAARHMRIELSLPVHERSTHGRLFVAKMRKQIDALLEKAPDIPMKLVKQFNMKHATAEFYKPQLLEVLPVEIYTDDGAAELRKLEMESAVKEAQRQLELETTAKVRREIEMSAAQLQKQRRNVRKSRLSAASVSKNMDRLLSSINVGSGSTHIYAPESTDVSTGTSGNSDDSFDVTPPPPPVYSEISGESKLTVASQALSASILEEMQPSTIEEPEVTDEPET